MNPLAEFARLRAKHIETLGADQTLRETTRSWFEAASKHRYSYHFDWMGIPIIQFPQDLVALQEVVWASKPDAIIETGIAHGGSLVFYASLLKAMGVDGPVIGIDIDIRGHNRELLDKHPLRSHIQLIEGSSTAPETLDKVREALGPAKNPLVVLDSNHEYSHVLGELELYSRFVRKGAYLVVLDTIVDDMPEAFSEGRPWGPGRGPKRAVAEFLQENKRFAIDQNYNNKLLITVAPDGFLLCTDNP